MNKGFEIETTTSETPNADSDIKKPLNPNENRVRRVDINVLKSRIQDAQSKEHKHNLIVLVLFLLALGSLGIYLSI